MPKHSPSSRPVCIIAPPDVAMVGIAPALGRIAIATAQVTRDQLCFHFRTTKDLVDPDNAEETPHNCDLWLLGINAQRNLNNKQRRWTQHVIESGSRVARIYTWGIAQVSQWMGALGEKAYQQLEVAPSSNPEDNSAVDMLLREVPDAMNGREEVLRMLTHTRNFLDHARQEKPAGHLKGIARALAGTEGRARCIAAKIAAQHCMTQQSETLGNLMEFAERAVAADAAMQEAGVQIAQQHTPRAAIAPRPLTEEEAIDEYRDERDGERWKDFDSRDPSCRRA